MTILNNLLLSVNNRKDYYSELMKYRDYFAGEQKELLSKRQLDLLNNVNYKTNICELVVTTKSDRINLRDMAVTTDNLENEEEINSMLWTWFKNSDYERTLNALFLMTLRDGDGYLIVDYDSTKQSPIFSYCEQYDGTSGVDVFYVDMEMQLAIKKWRIVETQETSLATNFRLNVYFKDRVLKAMQVASGEYMPFFDPTLPSDTVYEIERFDFDNFQGEGVVEYYTTDKKEIGIPVIHFTNNAQGTMYGVSELANVVSLQDTLNLAQASYLMATFLGGFNWILLTGSSAKQEQIKMNVGMIANINQKDVGVNQIQATNLTQLGEVVDRQLRLIATISKTPLAMLNPTGQLSAEGTLQQAETPLVKSIESKIAELRSSFRRLALMLCMIDKYSNINSVLAPYTDEQIINWTFEPEFEPLTKQNEEVVISALVSKHRDLKVPLSQIWQELGYSEDEIEQFRLSREQTRGQVLGQLALQTLGIESEAASGQENSIESATGNQISE